MMACKADKAYSWVGLPVSGGVAQHHVRDPALRVLSGDSPDGYSIGSSVSNGVARHRVRKTQGTRPTPLCSKSEQTCRYRTKGTAMATKRMRG